MASSSLHASPARLETVIITETLDRRPARPPDYEGENKALFSLMQHFADSPEDILQNLAHAALTLCRAGSAGISIEEHGSIVRWHGLAGELASHRW